MDRRFAQHKFDFLAPPTEDRAEREKALSDITTIAMVSSRKREGVVLA